MRFRLFVLDVDGTLIGESGEMKPRVKDAVRSIQVAGAAVAICTGRPLASCRPFIEELGLLGPQIVVSGALVRDVAAGRTVFQRPLTVEQVTRLVEFGRARELCLELYTDKSHVVERDWVESRRHAISVRVDYQFGDFDAMIGHVEIVKGQIIVAAERTPWLVGELRANLGDTIAFSIATPMAPCEGLKCINLVDARVSKGEAVRQVTDYYRLRQADVVGVGDAPNDLDMFAAVGWRVAMGNSDPAILAVADEVCPDVESEGLAIAIPSLLNR